MNYIILFLALMWAVAAENEVEHPLHLRTRQLAPVKRCNRGPDCRSGERCDTSGIDLGYCYRKNTLDNRCDDDQDCELE